MEKELQKIENQDIQVISSGEIISEAISKGADLEQVEKLLELKMRFEADEARKAYYVAMAQFKENPPEIDKDHKADFKTKAGVRVQYAHATLANVTTKISKALSECGLSSSWRTKQNGKIVVTCRLAHIKGHYEETTLEADADTTGLKNDIQAMGSTISYLERYTLLAITGLATHEQDNDAQSEPVEYITEKQQHEIRDLLIVIDTPPKKLCSHLGIETIEKMTKVHYGKAMVLVDEAKKRKGIK